MSWRRVLRSWLPVFAVLLLAANARAQLPPESLLAAAATTLRDESGSAWVLAAWQPTSGNVLTGRTLAVYLKSGTPGMPGPWRRMGLVGPASATSAAVQPLLQRGVALGDSEVALANTLAALIDLPEVRNADGTADRLAAALGLAATRPEVRSTLELLSSRFISVASALGRNWAAQVPVGPVTIEVRDHDVVTAADRFVAARLSVNAGFPSPLPAPFAPLTVAPRSTADDLCVGLVWAEPAELRHRAPLIGGYDVWRMPAAVARARGYETQAPSLADLAGQALRIHELPLATRPLTPAQAAAASLDPAQAFIRDRGHGAVPWADGEEFAWFVVPRDLLSQPGAPSTAGFGHVCAALPAPVPLHLEVANAFRTSVSGSRQQVLQLRWQWPEGHSATRLEIYRGEGELPPVASTNNLSPAGRIAVVAAAETGWTDASLDPAATPALFGHGFWYALRSVRETRCGPVYSALGPPVFVNLRQLAAPEPPTGGLFPNCGRVAVLLNNRRDAPDALAEADRSRSFYRVTVQRRDHGVAWAELDAAGLNVAFQAASPQLRLSETDETVTWEFSLPRPAGVNPAVEVVARCAAFAGAISEPVVFRVTDPPAPGEVATLSFVAGSFTLADLGTEATDESAPEVAATPVGVTSDAKVTLALAGAWDSTTTFTVRAQVVGTLSQRFVGLANPDADGQLRIRDPALLPDPQRGLREVRYRVFRVLPPRVASPPCAHVAFPANSAEIVPLRIRLNLTPRSRGWRVYRQVDDGPPSLIAQGTDAFDPASVINAVEVSDDAMPVNGARLCYSGQVSDENGNWSAPAPLGCEDVPPRDLPVPLVGLPIMAGNDAQPVVRLQWFCPPAGVSRFAVVLSPVGGSLPVQGESAETKPASAVMLASIRPVQSATLLVASELLTGPVTTDEAANSLGSGPEFVFPADVKSGVTYDVQVVALDARGHRGHPSPARRFRWSLPSAASDRKVPWPARPLPTVRPLHPRLGAQWLMGPVAWPEDAATNGVGIRIGEIEVDIGRGEDWPTLFNRTPLGVAISPVVPLERGWREHLYSDLVSSPPRPAFRAERVVLFRQQVASTDIPQVSGDVVQVSPRLDLPAGRPIGNHDGYELFDPHVALVPRVRGPNEPGARLVLEICLLDLHPVVQGARYRYWLTHFTADGEPDLTIPAGEVEVPQ